MYNKMDIADQIDEVMDDVRKAAFSVMKAEESTGAGFTQNDVADYAHGIRNDKTAAVEKYIYNNEAVCTHITIGADYLERVTAGLKKLQTMLEEREGK